mmetsp:Transcript_28104/g.80762  ORF Transcript_28104/g.80762 Transcript_28104/m.80762 type:complete len:536 (+) Transcript_28104:175-1782(+)
MASTDASNNPAALMAAYMNEVDDDVPPALRAVAESLECQICGDFFQAAVTIADARCGHSFCAECIRNTFRAQMQDSIARKRMCPICRCLCGDERKLIPNRALQEAVAAFQSSLPKVVAMTKASAAPATTETKEPPKQSPIPTPSPPSRSVRSSRRKASAVNYAEENDDQEDVEVIPSPSASKRPRVSLEQAPAAAAEAQPPSEPPITTRKPLVASYHKKKLRELKAMCQQEGLNTWGSEEQLKQRHREFITLWNCEVDNTVNPKTPSQVRAILAEREAARNREQSQANLGGAAQQHRGMQSYLEKGTSGNADLDQKIKGNFSSLIAQARERMAQQKRKRQEEQAKTASEGDSPSEHSEQQVPAPPKEETEATEKPAASVDSSSTTGPDENQEAKAVTNTSDVVSHPSPVPAESKDPALEVIEIASSSNVIPAELANPASVSQEPLANINAVAAASAQSSTNASGLKRKPTLLERMVVTRPREPAPPSTQDDDADRRPRRSILDSWSCERCTFLNENRKGIHAKCEMCGQQRPQIL